MNEKMPSTGLTLRKAKQYMTDNFISYTIAHVNTKAGLYFGLDVWDISALEEVQNINSVRKRNFRLYSQGLEEDAKVWYEATQGPISPSASEPSFSDRVSIFIKTKVNDGTIKFAYVVQINEDISKALGVAIMPDNTEKRILLKETEGAFSIEVL